MRFIDADNFREELKDRQWNLVEEDHESSVRMDEIGHWINKLDNAPTEDAIPIEWLEDWILTKMKWKEHITMGKLFTGEDAIRFYVQDMFYAMLMDWRDENESNPNT